MFLLARGVVGLLKPLFDHVPPGESGIGWLDRDTVEPTRKIANILIWIFALVMAYPYLPGAHTEAFKGMSVLIGLMVSLGASSIVGQGASGLILMYSRTLRSGEYVRIGEHEGTIVGINLFTTRLRTGRGAEITLPNALIVGSATRNYSRTVSGEGFMVDTSVTIGYDTPWRQVEAMLIEAALRTPGILATPGPAGVSRRPCPISTPNTAWWPRPLPAGANPRAEVVSRLHANIQDVFNEHGVQIMSPHYMADPANDKVVPPGKAGSPRPPASPRHEWRGVSSAPVPSPFRPQEPP
jgi:small-conductance mechanosensitive channel